MQITKAIFHWLKSMLYVCAFYNSFFNTICDNWYELSRYILQYHFEHNCYTQHYATYFVHLGEPPDGVAASITMLSSRIVSLLMCTMTTSVAFWHRMWILTFPEKLKLAASSWKQSITILSYNTTIISWWRLPENSQQRYLAIILQSSLATYTEQK